MFRIMINTMKLLFKKKTYIVTGVIAPAMVILFFSFAFGGDMKYKVGVINKDNKYISNEIIKSIREIEDVDVVNISKDNYEMLLASHQIQIAVIIDENFTDTVLNLDDGKVTIKSISNSDVKETLVSIIKSKVSNLSLIAKISDGDIDKFKEYSEEAKENSLKYSLSDVNYSRPSINNSIGIVIMIILISGSSIANFLIEDEEEGTKTRVFISGIKAIKYYSALLIIFYLMSCISSIIYYILCIILKLDFEMNNTNYFLLLMLMLNLVAIALNLCIVSFTRNRYIASTVNILIVIPTCMLSGVFWDFNIMPKYMQRIGAFMPQRLVYKGIEDLQGYGTLSSISSCIIYLLVIALVLFVLGIYKFNKKEAPAG